MMITLNTRLLALTFALLLLIALLFIVLQSLHPMLLHVIASAPSPDIISHSH